MATINYNSGNINVSFFPTNVNPIWFCDKNTGGINIATNGLSIAANTLQLGNSGTTTQVNGVLSTGYLNSLTSGTNFAIAENQINNGLDLGCRDQRTGWINIGRFMAGGNINIGDDHKAATNITMGTAGKSTTYVRGSTVNIAENGGTVNVGNSATTTNITGTLKSNTITSLGSDLNIGADLTTQKITIGDSGSRNGDTYISYNGTGTVTVGGNKTSGNVFLGSSATTTLVRGATISIGDNTTTGNIQIGYPSTFTGNIGIGTLMGGGSIDIGSYPTGNNQIVIGDGTKSTTYLRGSTIYIADGGTTVNIGNTNANINMTASNIKQSIKTQDGTVIQNVIGNADSVSSLSTTFNYKNTALQTPVPCYRIQVGASVDYMNQFFELVVSGNNSHYGPYSYKFMFAIQRYNPNIGVQNQTTVFPSGGTGVTLSFSYPDAYTATVLIQTWVGTDIVRNQSFITTLIAYPTCNAGGPITDYSITAI